jgi:hypothetical protein
MKRVIKKKGQIWVETVIYTLIGLAIIGLVLSVSKPSIDKKKSEIVIEQSIESLMNIDLKIDEVLSAEGNQRVVDLKIGEGDLYFNLDESKIYWVISSNFEYSEKDIPISIGPLTITTKQNEKTDSWEVYIEKEYNNIYLKYNNEIAGEKQLSAAPIPYKLVITNEGAKISSCEQCKIVIKITAN